MRLSLQIKRNSLKSTDLLQDQKHWWIYLIFVLGFIRATPIKKFVLCKSPEKTITDTTTQNFTEVSLSF